MIKKFFDFKTENKSYNEKKKFRYTYLQNTIPGMMKNVVEPWVSLW